MEKQLRFHQAKNSKYNFCNCECYNIFHKVKSKNFTCEFCGKKFESKNFTNANRFCSRECYNKFHAIKNKERVCPVCSTTFIAKASEGKYCSRECYNKDRHMPKSNKHWKWKGGIISEDEQLRKSIKYTNWREEILKRDKHKCVYCSSQKDLNAYHIYSWKFYPNLRFNIDNGITVCKECHMKIHKAFGYIFQEKMILKDGR